MCPVYVYHDLILLSISALSIVFPSFEFFNPRTYHSESVKGERGNLKYFDLNEIKGLLLLFLAEPEGRRFSELAAR